MRKGLILFVTVAAVLALGGGLALGLLPGQPAGTTQSSPPERSPAAGSGPLLAATSPCGYSAAGCGGCSTPAAPRGESSQGSLEERIRAHYAREYGDADVTVTVRDFGCHQEATVLKDGVVLRRFSISGDTITEIG